MNKGNNGFKGQAINGQTVDPSRDKKVFIDEVAAKEAATVMNAIRNHLPNITGESEEKISQGITNFLENNLKLTKVSVNVVKFGNNEYGIFPSFSINGTIIETPGKIVHQKTQVAAPVYN